jgi:AhpD family alkylhydroperoxidase
MPFLPSIQREDKVPHVLSKFNAKYGTRTERPLIEFHEARLRGESPFSVKERELMAAYVSGLNACRYCHGAHSSVAKLFGVPEALISELVTDLDAAHVDGKLKPVFAYFGSLH